MINEYCYRKTNTGRSHSSKIIGAFKTLETDLENYISQKYSDEYQDSN